MFLMNNSDINSNLSREKRKFPIHNSRNCGSNSSWRKILTSQAISFSARLNSNLSTWNLSHLNETFHILQYQYTAVRILLYRFNYTYIKFYCIMFFEDISLKKYIRIHIWWAFHCILSILLIDCVSLLSEPFLDTSAVTKLIASKKVHRFYILYDIHVSF